MGFFSFCFSRFQLQFKSQLFGINNKKQTSNLYENFITGPKLVLDFNVHWDGTGFRIGVGGP